MEFNPIYLILAFFMLLGMSIVFAVWAFFSESDEDWFHLF